MCLTILVTATYKIKGNLKILYQEKNFLKILLMIVIYIVTILSCCIKSAVIGCWIK